MDRDAELMAELRWHQSACAIVILTGWMLSVAALPAQDPPGSQMGLPLPAKIRLTTAATAAPAPPAPLALPEAIQRRDTSEPDSSVTIARRVRRDPFLRPEVASPGVLRCSGKGCLVAEDLTVRGVVQSSTRNFAIVVDTAGRVYFLGEREAVRGGVVERIAADGIVFRMQQPGKPAQRLVRHLANVGDLQ